MALIKCVECGNDVSDKAVACPHCGYKLQNDTDLDRSKPQEKKIVRNAVSIRKWLVPICIIGTIIIVGLILILMYNSPARKAKNAYRSRDKESYSAIVLKLDEKEKEALSESLKKDVDSIFDDYINGNKSAEEAKKALDEVKDYEVNKGYAEGKKKKITSFVEMDASYKTAEGYIDFKDYLNAYKELSTINDEDYMKYKEAQDLMNQIRPNAVEEASTGLSDLVNGNQIQEAYDYATSIKNVDLGDEALTKECNDAISKYEEWRVEKEEAKKAEEEREKQLTDGKLIITDNLQATFESGYFTDEILPTDTSGYYTYFEPENPSNVYYAMKFIVKNKSNYAYDMEDVFKVTDDQFSGSTYSYTAFYNYAGTSDMENIYSWDEISSGESVIMYLAFEVPSSKQNGNIIVKFEMDGRELELNR